VCLGLSFVAICAAVRGAEIAAPYVPTAPSVVERMLDIAKVGPQDFVIDLGSGDGRTTSRRPRSAAHVALVSRSIAN
jgi:hypothetical protein